MLTRSAIILALLATLGCGESLPPGVEHLTRGSETQSFHWSPGSRRLAYVEGRFPDRTYLVVRDFRSGARTRRRLKGFVLGKAVALSRDGRRVLLDAGKLGPHASDAAPTNRVILVVDAGSGRILSEEPLGPAGSATLRHPAWSPDPIAVWNTKDGVVWKAFGAKKSGGLLKKTAAWTALLLDEPYLILAEKQTKRPQMTVYDLRDNKQVAQWRVALTGVPLTMRRDGTALSARWMSETGSFVLESGNPKTGRRIPVLEAEGEIESALETSRGLYVIAKDPSRRNDTGKDFLSPRVLLIAESGGRRWSAPWTSHRGEFLGIDSLGGRLLFAVTDRDKPGVWAIAPSREALSAAGSAIDGISR